MVMSMGIKYSNSKANEESPELTSIPKYTPVKHKYTPPKQNHTHRTTTRSSDACKGDEAYRGGPVEFVPPRRRRVVYFLITGSLNLSPLSAMGNPYFQNRFILFLGIKPNSLFYLQIEGLIISLFRGNIFSFIVATTRVVICR